MNVDESAVLPAWYTNEDKPDTECSRKHETAVICAGKLFLRYSRSGLTSSTICPAHAQALEEKLDGIERRYAHTSSAPPEWFDPTYAGECWDED